MTTSATLQTQLILTFDLPGVQYQGRTSSSSEAQLENPWRSDSYTLKVNPDNVLETVRCLRDVITELERFAATHK